MTKESEANLPDGGTAVVLAAARKKAPALRTEEEKAAIKKYNKDSQAKKRAKDKEKSTKAAAQSASEVEISKKDAKLVLLDERKVQNDHVADVVVELLEVATRQNHIVMNRYMVTHGLRAALETSKTEVETEPPAIEPVEVEGEILHRTDLWALWDAGFWRNPSTTFEEWLTERRTLKSSAFEMSKILGKEDFAETHAAWTGFAPRWNPSGLPVNYTQKQGLAWLDAQRSDTEGGKKRYLLVASRNSMKSTWVRILALCLTVTYPDARILIVSETNKLSKKAMKEFRGYLEMAPNNPTLFQTYFAEFTIAPDEGQTLIFDNPLAHLGLPQNSVESSSMESSNTGSRFDFCIFDDPISRDNGTSNDEQKEAALSKHGSIMKLREPAGFAINVQTPWAIDDLGDTMIKRNAEDPEQALAVRIDPVMTVKPEVKHKPLLTLTEQDVVLNFLPKLNWKFVREEMRSPEGLEFFKSQYLCEWPEEEDAGLTVSFTEDEIKQRIRSAGFFDATVSNTVMSLDRAYSVSRYADYSCACVGRVFQRDNRTQCGILDVKLERLKESQLVDQCVLMIDKHRPTAFVLEKDKGHENLVDTIRKGLLLRGIPCPRFIAKDVPAGGKNLNSKARRIKSLELPLSDGRLWFLASAVWNDILIQQFVLFDGKTKSNSTRKDDIPDAISLLYETFMPKMMSSDDLNPTSQAKLDKEAEIERKAELARLRHAEMFGSSMGGTRLNPGPPTPQGPRASDFDPNRKQLNLDLLAPPKAMTPRERALEQMSKILPAGMRRRNF